MSTPYTTYAYPLSSVQANATTNRTSPTRWTEILNVKDFGALGDGTTNDTTAIQNCLDAAFGTYASPHGTYGPGTPALNKAVFFPGGRYIVAPPVQVNVSNAVNDGTGLIKLTVTSTTGLTTNDIVNVTGITGTTEANFVWTITVNDGTHITLQNSAFSNAYIAGGQVTSACLKVRAVCGGWIYGAGRFSTTIECQTNGGMIFSANGIGFSKIEGFQFLNTGTGGVCLNIDWMLADPLAQAQSTQSNSIRDCLIGGGAYGILIGASQNMGSENLIENCYISTCTTAGIAVWNFNAINQTVLGGNIASCDIGIKVQAGSASIIHGVGFQNQTTADIQVINSAGDVYSIHGCRREQQSSLATDFLVLHAGASAHIGGCADKNENTSCNFASVEGGGGGLGGGGCVTIDDCFVLGPKISGNGIINIRNSQFGNASYLTGISTDVTLLAENVLVRYGLLTGVRPKQRLTRGTLRTYDIEAANVSSDAFFLYESGVTPGTSPTVTMTSSDDLITFGGLHGCAANQIVTFPDNGDTLFTGLVHGKTYFVSSTSLTNSAFRVSQTSGGAPIDLTGAQAGTHLCAVPRAYVVGDQVLNTTVANSSNPGWICTTGGYSIDTVGGSTVAIFRALAPCS